MLKIYGAPISVHTRKVIVTALLKGLPHEVVPVVPVNPASLPPNWRQLSPTGLIPALTDGDFAVSDSTAICTYLDRIHPDRAIYPKAPRELAKVLSLEAYAGEHLFRNVVRPLFHEVFVNPKIRNQPTDRSRIDEVLNDHAPGIFGFLEDQARDDFLVGGAMTTADIAVTSNLLTYRYCGFDLERSRYGRLSALFERVTQEPALREALRRERPVVEAMGLHGDFLVSLAA